MDVIVLRCFVSYSKFFSLLLAHQQREKEGGLVYKNSRLIKQIFEAILTLPSQHQTKTTTTTEQRINYASCIARDEKLSGVGLKLIHVELMALFRRKPFSSFDSGQKKGEFPFCGFT